MSLSFLLQAFVVALTNNSAIRSSIAVAVVVVTVTDINDNSPVFNSSDYTASVSEAAQTGHIVLTSVEAVDADLVRSRTFLPLPQLEKLPLIWIESAPCIARRFRISGLLKIRINLMI